MRCWRLGLTDTKPFAELPETAAVGEIAALYVDLRAVSGVPLVNLIWRHLATLPGMLAWTWGVVRPLHVSGVLAAAREELLRDVRPPDGLGLPRCVFDVVGVTGADRASIAVLIGEYEIGNASNLLSLLAVLALLKGGSSGGLAAPPALALPGARSVVLPRLLALDEFSPELRALVLALDQFGRTAPSHAVASLYRHLGHWPGFLAVAHAALVGHHRDGSFRAAHERTLAQAREIMAARLLPVMAQPPAPDAAGVSEAIAALEQFTTEMIARMLVMGRALMVLLK